MRRYRQLLATSVRISIGSGTAVEYRTDMISAVVMYRGGGDGRHQFSDAHHPHQSAINYCFEVNVSNFSNIQFYVVEPPPHAPVGAGSGTGLSMQWKMK